MRHVPRPPKTRRRGFLSLELAAALPVLLALIAATVEFALLLSAQGNLADASRAAARAASLGVHDQNYLWSIGSQALGPRLGPNADVSMFEDEATGVVTVVVKVPMVSAAPNLLWPVGFDLSGRYLTAAATMAAETN
jgi:Flp pilus assembly protein TadG